MIKLGKRGKGKYKVDKSLKDAYALYLKKFEFPSQGSKYSNSDPKNLALSYEEFKTVVNSCFEGIMHEVLYKSKTFTLPFNLGEMRIQKKKMDIGFLNENKNLKVDWGHFQKTGKIIKHLNEDRDNCRYKFYWLCKKGPSGKSYYKFEPLRERRRELAMIIKSTNIDYFE
jgi:hypothetical protein